MNFEQLRGFAEVARLGHFTRAAESLHLSQPSLSRQIATLEQELGGDLFHRARGHISLTAAGELLLPYARRMLADADTVRQEMAELAGLQRGSVRLGATPSLCTSLVAEVVRAFRVAHPGIEIGIVESGSHGLVSALGEGALDLALLTSSDAAATATVSLSRTALLVEELVVVSSAALPPQGEGTITLTELSRLPQIAFHRGYDLRVTMDAAFAEASLVPRIVVEGPEMDAVLRFVERGVGVAVVPGMVALGRPELRAVPLVEPTLTRTVRLAHRADVRLTRAAGAMRACVVEIADGFAGSGGPVTRAH